MASAWHTSHADADPIVATPLADRSAAPSSARRARGRCARSRWRPARTRHRRREPSPDGLLALVAGPDGTTLTGWDMSSGATAPRSSSPRARRLWISAGRAASSRHPGLGQDRDERSRPPRQDARVAAGQGQGADRRDPGRTRLFRDLGPGGRTVRDAGRRSARRRRDPRRPRRPIGPDRLRDPARSVPSSPRRRSGSTAIASSSSPVMPPRRRRRSSTRRPARSPTDQPGARLLATSVNGRRIATMAGPGRPDRDPRHGRLAQPATGRRSRRSRRRADPRPPSRSRSTRPASASPSRGPPRTARSPSPSTTAARTGVA